MKSIGLALAVTLTYQVMLSIVNTPPPIMVPVVAPVLGVPPQSIGWFLALLYIVAMSAGLFGGPLIERHGPLRTAQMSIVATAAGLVSIATGSIAGALGLALLFGIGYGLINPVTSSILAKRAPPKNMALVFSIKQAGVPLGGALAGVMIPPLLVAVGWQWTFLVLAIACLVLAIVLQPTRGLYDAEALALPRHGAPPRIRGNPVAQWLRPLRLVSAHRALLQVMVMSSIYAACQANIFAYYVSHLNIDLGLDLVRAGVIYSAMGIAGIVGRILWAVVADRWVAPRIVLGSLGVIMGAASIATAMITASWPMTAMVAVGIVFGATAIGWNGIFFAEVARYSPPGEIGAATAGAQVFTYSGATIAPPIFAAIVSLTGHYAAGFYVLAVFPILIGLRVLLSRAPSVDRSASADGDKTSTASDGKP